VTPASADGSTVSASLTPRSVTTYVFRQRGHSAPAALAGQLVNSNSAKCPTGSDSPAARIASCTAANGRREDGFHIPPRKSLAAKATKLQNGSAAEAVKIFNENGIYDDPAFTPAMQTALFDAVSNVAVSGKDPKAQLDTAVSRIETELKKLFG
jgi:hypothetical protein